MDCPPLPPPTASLLPLLPPLASISAPCPPYHRPPLSLPLQSLPSPYPHVFALFLPSHNSRRPVAIPPTPSAPSSSPPSRSLGTRGATSPPFLTLTYLGPNSASSLLITWLLRQPSPYFPCYFLTVSALIPSSITLRRHLPVLHARYLLAVSPSPPYRFLLPLQLTSGTYNGSEGSNDNLTMASEFSSSGSWSCPRSIVVRTQL